MESYTLSFIFAAGVFIGTTISIIVVRKTAVYNTVWKQIKRKNHYVNMLQWLILTLFSVAVFVGFGSLISKSDALIQFMIGLGSGLMMALLPMKEMK